MLLTNYITSAWRNILRHKLFSAINILGLAIGLAAVMLIAHYVRYETSYDSFWKNADNIYRMQMTFSMPDRAPVDAAFAPLLTAPALKQDFPEIIHAARGYPVSASFTRANNTNREDIKFVDPEILDIFEFDVVAGDLNAALNDNLSLVLNETLAFKYFGDKNPIGETITIKLWAFEKDYNVGAIIKNLPANSHIEFAAMGGLFESDWAEHPFMFKSWLRPYVLTFFTLKPGTDIKLLNQQMDEFIDRHYPLALSGDPDIKPSEEISLSSLNIRDVHLKAEGFGDKTPFGDAATVFTFAVIAILILFIASVNFMNLSTARATERAKEVSLRKVMGAARKQLIFQFIGESIALTVISLVLGLALVEVYLPSFQNLVKIPLAINYGSGDLAMIFALAIIVGVFGGAYPAIILSSFHPAENLKSNRSAETKKSINFRTLLVILQFTISIVLFVATAIIFSQMRYTDKFDYGFDKENTLAIRNIKNDKVAMNLDVLLAEYSKTPNILSVTTSSALPGVEMVNSSNVRTSNMTAGDTVVIDTRTVGYDFFKTFSIEILNGRTFARERNDLLAGEGGEISSLIINELAVRELGFASAMDAIGQRISGIISLDGNKSQDYQIIGVTSNFHFGTVKDDVQSTMYLLDPKSSSAIGLRYTGSQRLVIHKLQNIWTSLFPDVPFNYSFSVDAIAQKYNAEKDLMTMFAAFSSLAIFIACLGLFGLASFTAERHTKEIGIRKVFGAEVWQIVRMLVFQFSKPVLIANIIAWPIAYLAMSRWLESFVYRIDDMMIIALCLIAGLTALLIAWATVAGNSYAVARQNPIKALRYE